MNWGERERKRVELCSCVYCCSAAISQHKKQALRFPGVSLSYCQVCPCEAAAAKGQHCQ